MVCHLLSHWHMLCRVNLGLKSQMFHYKVQGQSYLMFPSTIFLEINSPAFDFLCEKSTFH